MKRSIPTLLLLALLASGLRAQDLTLAEVLDRYYEAGNFGKLAAVKTQAMSGTIVQQDLMPVKVFRMRPDKYAMIYDVADLTACQAFDGNTGWFTAPWTGNAAPQVAAPDRTVDLRNRADMDGPLVDWKKKGHSVELAGRDSLDGMKLYKLKVTRKDGGIEYLCIDDALFLLRKRISYRMAGGKEITVENSYRDYRKVDGIPFPFAVETNNGGRVNEIQYDAIELDVALDPGLFRMPSK